jgi:hypothetical protein
VGFFGGSPGFTISALNAAVFGMLFSPDLIGPLAAYG